MNRSLNLLPATSIVITNMIGTGILITPGILCTYLSGPGQILLVWFLGGCIALTGAVVYGQLGSLMPHSGGEFYYLAKIYHPFLGLFAGWVSVIAGFAGPVAIAALTFSKYLMNFDTSLNLISRSWTVQTEEKAIAIILIILLCLIHYFRNRSALRFQLILTIILISFLLIISFLGIRNGKFAIHSDPVFSGLSTRNGLGMAVLLSVYSYTGWNASCYFAGEIRNPGRNIPLSLFAGVFLVMILYLVVNYGLLKTLGQQGLSGQIVYLSVFGQEISGKFGYQLITVTVLLILLASISSMIFACARIPVLNNQLSITNKSSFKISSSKTLWLQMGISLTFVLTSGFQQLMVYMTIILTVFSMITSFGVFLLPWSKLKTTRRREWFVKFSALFFTGILLLLVFISFSMDTRASLIGLILLLTGGIVFLIITSLKSKSFPVKINTR